MSLHGYLEVFHVISHFIVSVSIQNESDQQHLPDKLIVCVCSRQKIP